MTAEVWSREEFLARLREVGTQGYHHLHPFHINMNAGKLDKDAIQLWVANRFYYQTNIPRKDAAILANCPLREVRRRWIGRIIDHDGKEGQEGGIEQWLRLGIACGLTREAMMDEHLVRPGVRFAVDVYVNFAKTQPWPIAVASSLTELFAPDLMAKRLAAFEQHYPWVESWGFDYFRRRLTQARRDSAEGLELTLTHCQSPEMQDAAVAALSLKCDILWSVLDAIHAACQP